MFVFRMPNGYLRAKRGTLGETLDFTVVQSIDEATKSSSESFFNYVTRGETAGYCEEVKSVLIEVKHQNAMRFLTDLLDKEIAFAKEQEETAHLPEDRKDAGRDIEKMELIKELLGL